MTKHKLFAVSAIALLLMTALITGCSTGGDSGNKLPVGKGAVKLNFNDIKRTLLPDDKDINDFVSFDLIFTDTVASPLPGTSKTENLLKAVRNDAVILDPGVYSLEVIAYLGASKTLAAASYESTTNITVTAGSTESLTITLEAYDPLDGGSGSFDWTITDSTTGGIASGAITFTPILGGAAASVANIKTYETGLDTGIFKSIQTLTAGYYTLKLTVTKVVSGNNTVLNLEHILHIYKNMTSTFTYTVEDNQLVLSSGKVNVGTWHYNHPNDNNVPVLDDGSGPYGEGDTISLSLAAIGTTDAVIEVVSSDGLSGSITYDSLVWLFNGSLLETANGLNVAGDTLTLDGTTDVFKAVGVYPVTVIGTVGGIPYAVQIFIELTL